ncbi:MAG: CHAT domain-containing protein [Deltaproteobacteria bacterium]|uniref:CHAT domain-containing protein n=1 Tax=Candidatus Zymogenus saltonus TaxID=2844893 RepID=A0A9D8PQ93_9DELT|nr:CHAT domain-containing protein [Candidatus Zymogenus saltonus]
MKKTAYLLVPILLIAFCCSPVLAEMEGTEGGVLVISTGQGPKAVVDSKVPPGVKGPKGKAGEAGEESIGEKAIEESAVKNAILIYLIKELENDEFEWLEEGIDSVILSSPEKFVLKTKIVSSTYLPAAKYEIIKAEVTLNSALLDQYLENVRKLKPMPKGPAPPTTGEKEGFRSRGDEIFIQGEVASNIVRDHVKGIEAFIEAKELYEKAGYDKGVFNALLSIGRARLAVGDISGAMADLKGAVELSETLGMDEHRVRALLETARLYLLTGECLRAMETASSALDISSRAAPGKVPGALSGEALLLIGRADYLLGNLDKGITEVDRAADVFEKLGDLKRLNEALITLSVMKVSTGDASGAVEEIKLVKKISEALKDDESRVVALILLGRAMRETGEPEGAKIYAEEAKATASKAKWKAGEAMADIELSRILATGKDYDGAISSVLKALELANSIGSPVLTASAHRALGLAQIGAGKKKEALLSLTEVFKHSADAMTTKFGGIYLPIETLDLDTLSEVLTDIISLSKELGEEEAAFSALLFYQSIWSAERLYASDRLFDEGRKKLLSLWRNNIGDSLAVERLMLSTESNRYSESSAKILMGRREELKRSCLEAKKTIVKESPGLATLLGMKVREPKRLAREIGDDSIFVQYFMGRDDAFALVTSKNDLNIINLGAGPEMIVLSNRMVAFLSGDAVADEAAPVDGDDKSPGLLAPSFEETSRRLYAALIAPVLSEYPGVKRIGVSPGIALGSLPFQALGDYRGEDGFTFLVEDYDIFFAPSLFAAASTAGGAAENKISTLDYLAVVGEGRFSPVGVRWLFYEVVGGGGEIPAESEAVIAINDTAISDTAINDTAINDTAINNPAVNDADSRPWWGERSPLIFVFGSGANGMRGVDFFTMELFASYKHGGCSCVFVSEAARRGEVNAFFEAAIPRMRKEGILSAYFSIMRESAAGYGDGGKLGWVDFPMMCDF